MSGKLKVMVVDRSPTVQQILANLIASTPDLQLISTASSSLQAVQILNECRPDVILLDIDLLQTDGLDSIATIMQVCPVPVVLTTTHTELSTAQRSLVARAFTAGAVALQRRPDGPWERNYNAQALTLLNTLRTMATRSLVPSPAQEAAFAPV